MLKNVSQKYLNLLFHNVTPVAYRLKIIITLKKNVQKLSVIDLDIF